MLSRRPNRSFSRKCLVLCLLLATVGIGCAVTDIDSTSADYSVNLDRKIEASAVRTLTLRTGMGNIEIIGEENRREIDIIGVVSTHAESFPEAKRIAGEIQLKVQSEKTENPIVVVTDPRISTATQTFRYDVRVKVPHTVRIELEDGAGDINVGGLSRGLRVTSTSGRVNISAVQGGIELITQGASTKVQDVSGRIDINDGSGEMEVVGVTGDVKIEDTDGNLKIQNVSGNVTAANNPKGATVRNIDGDVTLIRITPASSTIQGVTGHLSYPTGSQ